MMINTYNNILINFVSPFYVTFMCDFFLIIFVGEKTEKGAPLKQYTNSGYRNVTKNVYIMKMTLCNENV